MNRKRALFRRCFSPPPPPRLLQTSDINFQLALPPPHPILLISTAPPIPDLKVTIWDNLKYTDDVSILLSHDL